MMKLIQNIDVYAPQHLGKKDVLTINDKIVKIKDAGSISAEGFLSETEIINGEGLLLTPGFIDCHVHVLGGGGEGGFANRTPEATMEGLTKFGVTTVVGCLGTDGIGRDMCALVAKTKGLNEQGMSAYCYTGVKSSPSPLILSVSERNPSADIEPVSLILTILSLIISTSFFPRCCGA